MKLLNKINKLIIGLSCLSVLSVISCDNEHTETIKSTPVLEKVSFSAKNPNGEDGSTPVTFAAGDKIKVYIVEGKETSKIAAKYYTTKDKTDGTAFEEDGTEFTFANDNVNIVISGGFYLESEANSGKRYTIKRFVLIKKDEKM